MWKKAPVKTQSLLKKIVTPDQEKRNMFCILSYLSVTPLCSVGSVLKLLLQQESQPVLLQVLCHQHTLKHSPAVLLWKEKKRQPGAVTKCQDPSWDADNVSRLPLCCLSPELWRVSIRDTKWNREIKRRWVIDLWIFVIVRFTNNTNWFG